MPLVPGDLVRVEVDCPIVVFEPALVVTREEYCQQFNPTVNEHEILHYIETHGGVFLKGVETGIYFWEYSNYVHKLASQELADEARDSTPRY